MRKIACTTCPIRETKCIAGAPEDEAGEFASRSIRAIYKRRQVVFHEGAPATGLYVVCSGAVKVYQSDRFGRDYILDIAGPGEILGDLLADVRESYSTSAEALTDAQLCYLPREQLIEFVYSCPACGMRILAMLSSSLAAVRRQVRALALKGAESRLAELLIKLARASGKATSDGGKRIVLDCSRKQIAEMVGVSTETVIRLLGRLKEKHLILTHRRELIITDEDKLAALANPDGVSVA